MRQFQRSPARSWIYGSQRFGVACIALFLTAGCAMHARVKERPGPGTSRGSGCTTDDDCVQRHGKGWICGANPVTRRPSCTLGPLDVRPAVSGRHANLSPTAAPNPIVLTDRCNIELTPWTPTDPTVRALVLVSSQKQFQELARCARDLQIDWTAEQLALVAFGGTNIRFSLVGVTVSAKVAVIAVRAQTFTSGTRHDGYSVWAVRVPAAANAARLTLSLEHERWRGPMP